MRDIQPNSLDDIPIGTRVCAYWSQQYRCFYPGLVSEGKLIHTVYFSTCILIRLIGAPCENIYASDLEARVAKMFSGSVRSDARPKKSFNRTDCEEIFL